MDLIKIVLSGEDKLVRLPDISQKLFDEFLWGGGSNDIEYKKYMIYNKMADITDYNSETVVPEMELLVECPYRGRVIKFKAVYDSDKDESFDENQYFGENPDSYQKNGTKELRFSEWHDLNVEEIDIKLAESGADREMDFDIEREYEKRYEDYLKSRE